MEGVRNLAIWNSVSQEWAWAHCPRCARVSINIKSRLQKLTQTFWI